MEIDPNDLAVIAALSYGIRFYADAVELPESVIKNLVIGMRRATYTKFFICFMGQPAVEVMIRLGKVHLAETTTELDDIGLSTGYFIMEPGIQPLTVNSKLNKRKL